MKSECEECGATLVVAGRYRGVLHFRCPSCGADDQQDESCPEFDCLSDADPGL